MKQILTLVLSVITHLSFSQDFFDYSNDSLNINSIHIGENITCNLHLPYTYNYSAPNTSYPIILIFDSQNDLTYPHIVRSLDLLNGESQIPESIIIGIPFTRQNRLYLTSNETKNNQSISGMQQLENFLFEELLPQLKKDFKANDHLLIVGHSRTGYLVNYLTLNKNHKINTAIALSSFYNEAPISLELFKEYVSTSSNFARPFNYYFSTGNTSEENPYYQQNLALNKFLNTSNFSNKNFKWESNIVTNANHMTNFWIALPQFLINAFSDYNLILNNWLYVKLKDNNLKTPIVEFKKDLQNISTLYGFPVNPSITQIYSISSDFAYQKNDLETAIKFILLGKKYYPYYYDFDLTLIAYYEQLKNDEKKEYWKKEFIKTVTSNQYLSQEKKQELLKHSKE